MTYTYSSAHLLVGGVEKRTIGNLGAEFGGAKLVLGEGVDVGHGLAAQGARDELHVVALHIRHHHDIHLHTNMRENKTRREG